jgi:O-antigen/teichoic acid export membrane protein
MLGKFVRSNVIQYVVLKYLGFGVQLINSMLIAKYLGLYYFGLYGFVQMILQYLTYTNFGIHFSYSVLGADHQWADKRRELGNTALTITIYVGGFLLLAYLPSQSLDLFPKFNFGKYAFLIFLIAAFQHFNQLYVNIFRLYGVIGSINIYYLLIPLFQLAVVLMLEEEMLFWGLMYATLLANVVGLVIFLKRLPASLGKVELPVHSHGGILLRRGIALMLYNLTFYGMVLAARTVASEHFSISEFGLFNFGNSVSNSIFLLLGSINFLIYPKLISVISKKNREELFPFIEKIRNLYLTFTILVVFLSLLFLPVLFYFLPQYERSFETLQILLLGQLLINNSFGYSTLLVQKGKETHMTVIAAISIVIIVFSTVVGLQYWDTISTVGWGLIVGVLFYNIYITFLGCRAIDPNISFIKSIKFGFNVKLFAPVLFYIGAGIFFDYYIAVGLSIFFYLLINFKELRGMSKLLINRVREGGDILSL